MHQSRVEVLQILLRSSGSGKSWLYSSGTTVLNSPQRSTWVPKGNHSSPFQIRPDGNQPSWRDFLGVVSSFPSTKLAKKASSEMTGVLRISVFYVIFSLNLYINLFGLELDDAIVLRNTLKFLFFTCDHHEYRSC